MVVWASVMQFFPGECKRMPMLRGFLVLVLFFILGESVRLLLDLPVSGGVLGMVVITFTLMIKGSVSNELAQASQGLISVLVLLIMPGVVGVFFAAEQFSGQWLAVAAALLAGTFLSVLTTLLLMKAVTARGVSDRGELFARFQTLPDTLAATPILAIGLTLGAFFAGNWLFSRIGRPLWLPRLFCRRVCCPA